MSRSRYVYDLTRPIDDAAPAQDGDVRAPTADDVEALARLMLDAYRGTIDYADETLDDARSEVAGFYDDGPLLGASWVVVVDDEIVSACLVSDRTPPLIGYVMTAAAWKNSGLAARLVVATLHSLAHRGAVTVDAWITDGNRPSEALFTKLGFVQI